MDQPHFLGVNLGIAGCTPIKTVCYALDVSICTLGWTECSAKDFIPPKRDKVLNPCTNKTAGGFAGARISSVPCRQYIGLHFGLARKH